ncbi:MAG: DNA polymerase I [Gammaproteobacteria bacterium]|nr:DNA polymerase I [Gammaproteobacteria bacterium]NIM72462.1 DNA polymerase I [Gammaproteobacteria bacterium]NIO24221.1 DNA polymerase I [Gammaproteobacteria bacterium]NIO64826.1 DNA polymerase I [Gammaproteobacteria bacterium]NIP63639.1 DNA polymerase I [Gammaproteobacteria bacterium]
MSERKKQLVLIDGSSYLYRAFHAMPMLTNSKGTHTGAAYGITNMLRRVLAEYQPTHLAVVLDAKGKTFRDELYAEYKANRPPMPDEMRQQLDPIRAIVEALGITLLEVPGVEADDVIGTLAEQAKEHGFGVTISTSDKDMAQLVNKSITMVNTMDGGVLDPKGVKEKFGIAPEQVIDYLTLIGDTVDNVPGVPKVGPKTAAKWLQQYGTLDDIMGHAAEIGGKVGENLRECLDRLPLSRTLVTIKRDVELDVGPEDLQRQAPDNDRLRDLYAELEFKTWLSEILEGSEQSSAQAARANYETVTDAKRLTTWIKRLKQSEYFAFDTETTSLDYMSAELVGVSFAVEPGEAAYVPCGHDYVDAPEQISRSELLAALKPLLEDPKRVKLGQNLKYDMSVLARCGIDLVGVGFDTMLESYVLDSTATRHDMDSLALKYLSHRTIHFEDIAGKGSKQLTFNQIPLEQAAAYAAEDADVTLQLHRTLWPRLEAEQRLKRLFEEIEMPLVPVLSCIERNGVLVDRKMLEKQSSELAESIENIAARAYEEAGEVFNLGSPKQIQGILFEKLDLPVLEKTPKGQPSTAESVLQELALDYPLPKLILEYRSMSKLKSTYTDALPACINSGTGRVHTSYHQAVASTGRLSSTDPNLQNIPVRTPEGRRIRQAFIAPEGHRILAADYSQIELRIMAHLSGDEGLKQAFESGEDIHRATASEVFGVAFDEVDDDERRSAKAINFGLIYGMSAFGLGRQLGIPRREAQEYVDLYFARYPGVKRFMEETRERARERGFVETVFGRRLYLPEIKSRNPARRQYAERTAINAPMQGTAADIIKRAMIALHDWLGTSGARARMIMQVHDELVLEVVEDAVDDVQAKVKELMESAAELSVPLKVDTGSGKNWDEAH